MIAADGLLPADLRRLGLVVAGRLGSALAGGSVFTDDRAPVEWLTDLSIVNYAIGNRPAATRGGR
jgi:hypothetical protein